MAGLLYLALFIVWDWIGDLILFLGGLLLVTIGIPLAFLVVGAGLLWLAYS